ncbi:MAG: hypothetical protein U9N61_10945 [Euryarchaeota archaeon]|nr:hypothetical protein [Euryarchaeota archaeon]
MRLKTIRGSFHAQFLKHRQVSYIINSDDFAIAYFNATELEQTEIGQAVQRADKETLINFIKTQLLKLTPFHQMALRQLREIGRNTQIPDYWKKDKATLIKEIEDVVTRLKTSGE